MTTFDLVFLAGACGGTTAAWVALRGARVERFRFELFALRRELFDYAAEGHIAFDHPAFVVSWARTNRMIQRAHRLSLFYVVMMSVPLERQPLPANRDWDHALAAVEDVDVRQAMLELHFRRIALLQEHLLRGSVLIYLVRICRRCVVRLGRTGRRLKLLLARGWIVLTVLDATNLDDRIHVGHA